MMRTRILGKISFPLIRKLMVFGGPILFGNFAILLLSISDRWFLKALSTEHELGLYSFGYKFSDLILTFIVYTFQLAWTPLAWKAFATEKGREMFFMTEKFVMVVFPILTFVFIPAIIWLSYFMTKNHEFDAGLQIIFIISFAHVLYGYYSFNATKNFYFNRKKHVILANIFSACINVLLNWLLIPGWGMFGAGFATIFSYLLMFLILELVDIDELDKFKYARTKLFFFNFFALIGVALNSFIFISTGSKALVTISSLSTALSLIIILFLSGIFNIQSLSAFIAEYRSMRNKPANPTIVFENEKI